MPSRPLYRALSSVVENSILDEGIDKSSIRSINHANMTVVVPSKAVRESLRETKHLLEEEDEEEDELVVERRDWTSFVVVYTMIFFNGACFTAVVPSVPFYLEILGAPPSFLGWVVSFYSLGQICGSPTAGFLADKLSSQRMLTISSTLGLISSTLYAVAPNHWFVLASRWLTGVSAGTEFTTELAFIARNTTAKERTTFLASVTAVNVVGFIMGPALTTVLATLDFTIFGLNINQYTGPGWLLALMFLADIIMVQTLFRDKIESDDLSESDEEDELLKDNKNNGYGTAAGKDSSAAGEDTKDVVDVPPPSLTIVLSLIFVQFTVMCAWSVLETITSPLAYEEFDWNVQECNILFTCGGFVSLLAYVGFVVASKWVQDRILIVYALIVCFAGLVLMIDWPQLVWVPTSAAWPPYMYRFVIGYMIMNAGFMTGRPVTFALYSKLIAPEYQGKYLGWMVAGGSAARTLGPFAAVYLYYEVTGPGNNMLALFGTEALFQLVCLVLVIILWKHLLPVEQKILDTSSQAGISMHINKQASNESETNA